jgi:hypothetical protein
MDMRRLVRQNVKRVRHVQVMRPPSETAGDYAMAKKAVGERGSWFARVDGERLPCVHEQWWKKEVGQLYHDQLVRPGERQCEEFVAAIRAQRRVVLTRSKHRHGADQAAERDGYIAVFEVDDIEFDDDGLRFRFTKRIDELN